MPGLPLAESLPHIPKSAQVFAQKAQDAC